MTTWTPSSTTSTSWNQGDGINESTSLIYDHGFAYDVDYLTYDGYYVEGNTDWLASSQVETAWKEL